jgi:polyhydroxyalkanoate synthesis regulator protein
MTRAFGASTPMAAFEEQAQRNMAMFQQAMKMWAPFAAPGAAMPGMMNFPGMPKVSIGDEDSEADKDAQVTELRRQMEAMQKQLDAMARGKS